MFDDFRDRVRQLRSEHLLRDTGDHVLNPDMGPYARWEGPPRDAAVLIPVVADVQQPRVILTLRTSKLSTHAGQIAFPGGKIDADDGSPMHAALREAHEEIGLDPLAVTPIGELAPYLTGSGFRVVPIVAEVAPEVQLVPNPDEVEDVFDVPLSFLMDPENHRKQSRDWNGRPRYFYEMPYENRYIWGVTAGIIRSLYDTVYGR
ncbi:CoA pyrophosphatase [Roseibium sp.]|uniref:CoA pyrophosphatase n=1 Tax=Roseibium sp. TaxID=1936156 RepID=UPI003A9743DD